MQRGQSSAELPARLVRKFDGFRNSKRGTRAREWTVDGESMEGIIVDLAEL
jgi:hypothetical protein